MSLPKFWKEMLQWKLGNGPQSVGIGFIAGQSAIPVIVLSSGTVATNGTITLGTALGSIYGNAWGYLPANAVSGDATGGLYFIKFSSTTVGVVYAGKVGGASGATGAFTPYIPTSLVAVTGSNAAYTQILTAINVAIISLTGGLIGANGVIRQTVDQSMNNSVGSKGVNGLLGVATIFNDTRANVNGIQYTTMTRNRGVQNSQRNSFQTFRDTGAISGNENFSAIDTSATQLLTYQLQITTATDYTALEGFTVEVLPRA